MCWQQAKEKIRMKTCIAFLGIFILSCSSANFNKDILISSWTIVKVENINTGQIGPEELNQGTKWTFNIDNSYSFEIRNDYFEQLQSGTWKLVNDTIKMTSETNSSSVIIESLTENKLVWRLVKSDTLRFYLRKINNE